jgi:hypothetical protein
MEQIELSSAFAQTKTANNRVVCCQRTNCGQYVGTLSQTDTGYTGHILAPLHPMLAASTGSTNLGFLHDRRHIAYEKLAMHVAKQSWDGQLSFQATCLEGLDDEVKLQFENWLIDTVCNSQQMIRHQVVAERQKHLVALNVNYASGSGSMQ